MNCNIVISIVVQREIEGKRLCGDWTCQELGLACEVDKLYESLKAATAGQMDFDTLPCIIHFGLSSIMADWLSVV